MVYELSYEHTKKKKVSRYTHIISSGRHALTFHQCKLHSIGRTTVEAEAARMLKSRRHRRLHQRRFYDIKPKVDRLIIIMNVGFLQSFIGKIKKSNFM